MSHDHVGVPKFIKSFSIDDRVFCYNLKIDRFYGCSIDRLGTKNNYYDEDVEKRNIISRNRARILIVLL